ncbi:hypothetical protein FNV43_RR10538 [Rhamnella rubrinervis]|uniref:NB-ARC domain-containing protein n=1 Tax=Rhamnella rubrinervis TaxID=2594499 RepID=A0A8K0H426_9ROSA|nr:hypothetical protein FNV43_RR10538 [Rhamnella rubrinervis]
MDDIWDRLDLDAVGIPCGSQHPGCSILLTSRNVEACSQRNFTIEVLSDGEAWNLFEDAAGISINTRDLYPIAKQIAKECRGLPVAIVTVASNKEHGFVVSCAGIIDEWPEIDRREDYTTISIVADQIKTRLDNLRCPNLKLLHLSTNRILNHEQEFKENFCDEMKEIKVFALRNMRI